MIPHPLFTCVNTLVAQHLDSYCPGFFGKQFPRSAWPRMVRVPLMLLLWSRKKRAPSVLWPHIDFNNGTHVFRVSLSIHQFNALVKLLTEEQKAAIKNLTHPNEMDPVERMPLMRFALCEGLSEPRASPADRKVPGSNPTPCKTLKRISGCH